MFSPVPVHCLSPVCKADPALFSVVFYVPALHEPCPQCGLRGHLVRCDAVHLVVPERLGLIAGSNGTRYNFLCASARKSYLLGWRHPLYPLHYTDIPQAVSCPECLREFGFQESNGRLLLPG